jgi:predicted tellurium resistance membrane protein TerC
MELFTFENLAALVALTSLEIVLGFDNIVILTVLVSKLKPEEQDKARTIGLSLAMLMRILLLFSISWVMLLTKPIFAVAGVEFSGKSLVLLIGGLFLIGKATVEIHDSTEGGHEKEIKASRLKKFWPVITQILLLDLVFSIDSVITAVGMSNHLPVMVLAIVSSVGLMFFFAKPVGDFIEKHPTFKILALSFLVLVGVMLVAEGFGKHVEKGYIYFAITFSLAVEFINLRMKKNVKHH